MDAAEAGGKADGAGMDDGRARLDPVSDDAGQFHAHPGAAGDGAAARHYAAAVKLADYDVFRGGDFVHSTRGICKRSYWKKELQRGLRKGSAGR